MKLFPNVVLALCAIGFLAFGLWLLVDPAGALGKIGIEARNALAAEMEAEWAAESQPWEAAANIILDDVIDPRETRQVIAEGIDFAWGTRPRVSVRGTA
mgnify:CR=1 FL=1